MMQLLVQFFRKRKFFSPSNYRLKAIVVFIGLLWYSSSGYLYFEMIKKPELSWSDAIWWSLVTMATVGYGDYFPVTDAGRFLVGVPTMIFGIGFLGFIISITATKLIESRSRKLQGLIGVKMKNHILIINYTDTEEISSIVEELQLDEETKQKEICLIDETLEEIPQKLLQYGLHYVKGNPADETTLEKAGLTSASHAIILSKDRKDAHSDDQNLATTLIMEKMNPNVFSVVEVLDKRKVHQMEVAGADSAVCLSGLRSNLIIQEIQDPGVKNIIEDLTSNKEGEQLYFIPIECQNGWTYKELVIWGLDNHFSILGIQRNKAILLNRKADFNILPGDHAIAMGSRRIHCVKG